MSLSKGMDVFTDASGSSMASGPNAADSVNSTAKYVVTYGAGKELPPLNVWDNALAVAKELNQHTGAAVSIVNVDGIDVCPDSDCKSCNRDGLTPEQLDALNDAGIG